MRVDPRTRHWSSDLLDHPSKNPMAAALPPALGRSWAQSDRSWAGTSSISRNSSFPSLSARLRLLFPQTERCSSGWKRRPPAGRGRLVPCLFVVANGKSEVPPKGHQAGGANRFVVHGQFCPGKRGMPPSRCPTSASKLSNGPHQQGPAINAWNYDCKVIQAAGSDLTSAIRRPTWACDPHRSRQADRRLEPALRQLRLSLDPHLWGYAGAVRH